MNITKKTCANARKESLISKQDHTLKREQRVIRDAISLPMIRLQNILVTLCLHDRNERTNAHTHTHTHNHLTAFVRDNPGRPVPEETLTHSHPTWSLDILYHLAPFTTIHGILFVHFTCFTILSDNLSPPGPLWSSSWSWTLNFILHAFLHPIIIIFSQHMPIPTQPVLLQNQCYVIYT